MVNFGGSAKNAGLKPGTYKTGEQASRSAQKTKTPRPESGRKIVQEKCTTTAVHCQGKSAYQKQNRGKPLNCWEILRQLWVSRFRKRKSRPKTRPQNSR